LATYHANAAPLSIAKFSINWVGKTERSATLKWQQQEGISSNITSSLARSNTRILLWPHPCPQTGDQFMEVAITIQTINSAMSIGANRRFMVIKFIMRPQMSEVFGYEVF
jgi:hypothetical protein